MDDPVAEIETAINRCAAALDADAQIAAFDHYFVPDSSFLHPLCYVGRSSNSRARIVQVYMFYRAVIPRTSFEIQSVAFDPKNLHLYVSLIQRPEIWGLSRFVVPTLPMLIHFKLQKGEHGKYLIAEQEDNIQPMNALLCFPILQWFGIAIYLLCQICALVNGRVLRAAGVWTPRKLHKKDAAHLRNDLGKTV